MKNIIRFICSLLILALCVVSGANSSFAMSLIRDSEIEGYLQEWSGELVKAAGLEQEQVKIILVNSPEVNAFVAGGPNIFIYTGLLQRSESAEEVAGVIAHELGHIAGGHLTRARAAMQNASYEAIIGMIIGLGAAILSGQGEAASAIGGGAQSFAASKYLAHSRVQESSADQAAVKYLDRAKVDPRGLKSFLQKLQEDEYLPASQQSEYFRTHPITRNRISAIENKLGALVAKNHAVNGGNSRWKEQHKRMQAKLLAFISPEQVEWHYDKTDKALPAVMAYSIAAYRQSDEDLAVRKVRELVKLEPQNPYHHELEGQILTDFGRLDEARGAYKTAIGLVPHDGLIAIAYAHVLIESAKGPGDLNTAIKILKHAQQAEPRSTHLYRLLATAYGRNKQEAKAQLYLAQEAFLKRRLADTQRLANRALKGLEENTQEWRLAKDLLFYAENNSKKN